MSNLRARVAVSLFVVCGVPLAACGDDSIGGLPDAVEPVEGPGVEPSESQMSGVDEVVSAGGVSGEIRPPEFMLTGVVDPPAESVLDPANCGRPDDSGPPYFDYYVPADWVVRGSGSAGSGGVPGSGDHSYELPDGTIVHVEIRTDTYLGDQPVDGAGTAWTTWDYDLTSYDNDGEETTRIVYTAAGHVDVDGHSFDLWFLDQAQNEWVSRSEYKLRVVFADVPTGMPADADRRPESAEVTISWNADDGVVSDELVRELVSTFRVAPCAQDALTELYGMLTGTSFSSASTPDEGD